MNIERALRSLKAITYNPRLNAQEMYGYLSIWRS